MAVPRELTGVWRRCALWINGTRRVDYNDALWLQAHDWFADTRIPVDAERAPQSGPDAVFARQRFFAGVAVWRAPVMTWDHRIDARQPSRPDTARLELKGNLLLEHGTFEYDGHQVNFLEEWVRLSAPGDRPVVRRSPAGLWIAVGEWALQVRDTRPSGSLTAARQVRTPAGWQTVVRLTGDGTAIWVDST